MDRIIIRKATIEDTAEIANVHINSWREAYKGLLPQDFLDEGPLNFKKRYELWKKVTQNPDQVTLVAESADHGIVGFVNGTHGRDKDKKDWCEVWSIYLLEKYHNKKIGFNLLKQYFDAHIDKGFTKGYLWVLDNNPTIKFYEKVGGRYEGRDKEDEIADQKVKELMFVWDDIKL